MHYILIILSIIIIALVGLQAKGSGLSIIPNSNDFGKFERRGGEKVLHQITIGIIVLFIVACLLSYFMA